MLVYATGAKSWIYRKQQDGRRFAIGLGPWPVVPLAKAAAKAHELNVAAYEGVDLRAKEQHQKQVTLTFGDVARRWLAGRQDVTPARVERMRRDLFKHAAALIDVPVVDLTAPMVADAVRSVWATASGQQALSTVAAVWGAGVAETGQDVSVAARVDQVKQLLPKRARRAVRHYPMIPVKDLPAWLEGLRQCDEVPAVYRIAIEVVLLTNRRPREVLEGDWSEVDLEAAIWRVPADRVKTRTEHIMPLSPRVVDLLKERQRETGPGGPIFSTTAAIAAQVLRRKYPMPDTPTGQATLHGTSRATFRTWASDQGYPSDVVEAQLGHVVGNQVQQAYDRSNRLELRKKLVADYAAFVGG